MFPSLEKKSNHQHLTPLLWGAQFFFARPTSSMLEII
jgi:hypothetical protein